MNNFPSSSDVVMAMVISHKTTRRESRKNLKKKRANSGHKPEKPPQLNRPSKRKGKEGIQRLEDPLLGRV